MQSETAVLGHIVAILLEPDRWLIQVFKSEGDYRQLIAEISGLRRPDKEQVKRINDWIEEKFSNNALMCIELGLLIRDSLISTYSVVQQKLDEELMSACYGYQIAPTGAWKEA